MQLNRISTLAAVLALVGLAPIAAAAPCDAPGACETIGGPVFDDEFLPAGTYYVEESILVSAGASLTIEKGTKLYFRPAVEVSLPGGGRERRFGAGLASSGKLIIEGTPDEPVVMAANADDPLPGDWEGLSIAGPDAAGSIVRGARIQHAATSIYLGDVGGVEISGNEMIDTDGMLIGGLPLTPPTRIMNNIMTGDGKPRGQTKTTFGIFAVNGFGSDESGGEILDNTISGYAVGIVLQNASMLVSGNTLDSNRTGLSIERGAPRVLDNTIQLNFELGIETIAADPLIQRNRIMRNDSAGIAVFGGTPRILDNTIARNIGDGVLLRQHRDNFCCVNKPDETVDPGPLAINGNTFTRNGIPNGFELDILIPARFGPVNARNNTWNGLDPAMQENRTAIGSRIADGTDSFGFGNATADF